MIGKIAIKGEHLSEASLLSCYCNISRVALRNGVGIHYLHLSIVLCEL